MLIMRRISPFLPACTYILGRFAILRRRAIPMVPRASVVVTSVHKDRRFIALGGVIGTGTPRFSFLRHGNAPPPPTPYWRGAQIRRRKVEGADTARDLGHDEQLRSSDQGNLEFTSEVRRPPTDVRPLHRTSSGGLYLLILPGL